MDPMALGALWDSPIVGRIAFQNRTVPKGTNLREKERDGVIPVEADVCLGYRLCYNVNGPRLVVVFFHGNAELCCDVSNMAGDFYALGAAVLAVDYRGYGWSTGVPQFSKLCPDAERAADLIPAILEEAGLGGLPLVAHGRSIGATCAVHLAAKFPNVFKGLMVESGLMTVKDLPMIQPILRLVLTAPQLLPTLPEPVRTLETLKAVTVPTLIIHGDEDEIVPFTQAQAAFERCQSKCRKLERVRGAGHNDLHRVAPDQLLAATRWLYRTVTEPPLTLEAVMGLSVKGLQQELKDRCVDASGCVEKEDLVKLLLNHLV